MFKLCEKITFFCFVYIFAFFRNNYSAFLDPPPLPPLQEQIGALKRGWDLTRVSKPSLVHSNILNPPLRIIEVLKPKTIQILDVVSRKHKNYH